ncbi:YHYH protein [Maribacter sp. Asnod1-A12]|uniref:YHYH protein n=1 Tax=Maribacter sp. Asnod1-A12 TaxID=3160576 RepID=UPI0038673921
MSTPNGAYFGKLACDYEFQDSFGDLNECNERTGVTPEFPKGTYYYIVSDEFPSASRCFMGTPSNDFKIGGGRGKTARRQNKNQQKNRPQIQL